jgi:3-oxoacyl-[acyl-carrier protein] reductase
LLSSLARRASYLSVRILTALTFGSTSGGIGAATARLFAQRGVNLALHYFSKAAKADALAAELGGLGVRARAYQCDLRDFDAVRAMHACIVNDMGDPDILYNNAAAEGTILGIRGKIEDVKMEELESCWRSNVGAAFLVHGLYASPG